MSSKDLIMTAASGNSATAYVDDVFSTYLYTGNGSTQTINNGIDLAGKGGLVWQKGRSTQTFTAHNWVTDTARGVSTILRTNDTVGNQTGSDGVNAFNTDGFVVGNNSVINENAKAYVSWTFRKAPKFFDVVTYTGNAGTLSISHALGTKPGCIIIKKTNTTGDWLVISRKSDGNIYAMYLNTTAAQFYDGTEGSLWTSSAVSINWINSNVAAGFNDNTATYVAYLFAHDTATDGIIQCGSFTTDGSGNATVNLGWEPQFIVHKRTNSTSDWKMLDSMRGIATGGVEARLLANSSAAEDNIVDEVDLTATGFNAKVLAISSTYIYLAIRRPNKPPTSGTQVYKSVNYLGGSGSTTATITGVGFSPDLSITKWREAFGVERSQKHNVWIDKLRGASYYLQSDLTNAQNSSFHITGWLNDGVSMVGNNFITTQIEGINPNYINHFFRRAPGFFDEVCYTGVSSDTTVTHNLGVSPEMVIVKSRDTAGTNWEVSVLVGASNYAMTLDRAFGAGGTPPASAVSSTTFTTTVVSGSSGSTYVAYLFATCPGVSKVGSYTGNGGTQTINCGFSTGARFILIKRTDSTGDWYVWDTVRGIVAANDPHLSLNSTAAEVTTDDSIDPDNTGFIVNNVAATNINVTSATYIFLAIA